MNTREKAPTILTKTGARRKTDRLVTTLTEAHELLIELWEGRAWEALGYPNWQSFCAEEGIADLLMVKLPVPMRREAVSHMRDAGMSIRNIAAPLGVSVGTIASDIHPPKPKPVDPNDGLTAWQRVARHVAAQENRGLTCREYEAETGIGHGAASAAFHAAERKGAVVRSGRFRVGYAAYLAA